MPDDVDLPRGIDVRRDDLALVPDHQPSEHLALGEVAEAWPGIVDPGSGEASTAIGGDEGRQPCLATGEDRHDDRPVRLAQRLAAKHVRVPGHLGVYPGESAVGGGAHVEG